MYLADQNADYRQAWGEWVAAKLAGVRGSIDGLVIEVHAGTAYVDAIEEPLRRRGAVLFTPLTGLRRGEQLGWYDRPAGETRWLQSQNPSAVQLRVQRAKPKLATPSSAVT